MARGRMATTLKVETGGHQMGAVARGGCEPPCVTSYFFYRRMGEPGLASITSCTSHLYAYEAADHKCV